MTAPGNTKSTAAAPAAQAFGTVGTPPSFGSVGAPATPAMPVSGRPGTAAAVYVHFPWCLAKCPYCDFVSYAAPARDGGANAIDHAGYADAVIRELETRAPLVRGRTTESVFFGGGTPSLWDARQLGRVLAAVRSTLDCADDLEVTVECNPTSLDEDRARALADAGVNRLSIGVQSLDDARLKFLGRLHDAQGAVRAMRGALNAGIPRVSGDLIFGLPEQSPAQARDEALALADLGPTHLSCYQLTIEHGTRFGELARRGRLPLADDGAVAESFLAIDDALGARGFRHYEISNYAQPAQEARHNVAYWKGTEYLGLGCGAYGFARASAGSKAGTGAHGAGGVRWRNPVVPERYVEATRGAGGGDGTARADADPLRVSDSVEELDAETLLRERIMLGLRMAEGLDLDAAGHDLGAPGWTAAREKTAAALAAQGRLERDGDRIRIPRAGWLWTDDTAARLF